MICKEQLGRMEESEQELMADYKAAMNVNCVAMIIGAGCTAAAYENTELPQWGELLSHMLKGTSSTACAPPPELYLEAADKIEKEMKSHSSKCLKSTQGKIGEILSDELIENWANRAAAANMREYVKLILGRRLFRQGEIPRLRDHGTLKSVIDVCVYRVKKGLRTIIIMYNFEDTFEFALREKGISTKRGNLHVYAYGDGKSDLKTVTQALMNCRDGAIELFYVHGKIPFLTNQNDKGNQRIVLSSRGYEELSLKRMASANQAQYITLSSIPCVAIGFSCNDSNFKRLRRDLKEVNEKAPQLYLLKYCSGDCGNCDNRNRDRLLSEWEILKHQGIETFVLNKGTYSSMIEEMANNGGVP